MPRTLALINQTIRISHAGYIVILIIYLAAAGAIYILLCIFCCYIFKAQKYDTLKISEPQWDNIYNNSLRPLLSMHTWGIFVYMDIVYKIAGTLPALLSVLCYS